MSTLTLGSTLVLDEHDVYGSRSFIHPQSRAIRATQNAFIRYTKSQRTMISRPNYAIVVMYSDNSFTQGPIYSPT